jgi:hypothetical protein
MSKKSPLGKLDSMLAGLPNVKKTPSLSESTEILENDILRQCPRRGASPHLLKGIQAGFNDSGKSADGDMRVKSGTGSPPSIGPREGKGVGAPSGSTFRLDGSPSSDSENSERT